MKFIMPPRKNQNEIDDAMHLRSIFLYMGRGINCGFYSLGDE